jgi:hypothetical protein
LAVVAALSTVAGVRVASPGEERATPASWSLLGVADGGRALRVRGPAHGACERVAVEVDESDERITISASIRSSPPAGLTPRPDENYACPAILLHGEIVTLALDAPVAGRAVTGPSKVLDDLRLPYRVSRRAVTERGDVDTHDAGLPSRPFPVPAAAPPRVVGLRYRDAHDALCNAGFQARPLPRGTGRGIVVAQRPPRRQAWTGGPREPTCTNGILPAVDVATRAR